VCDQNQGPDAPGFLNIFHSAIVKNHGKVTQSKNNGNKKLHNPIHLDILRNSKPALGECSAEDGSIQEEIPNLEDAAYESVLSTDWHPFYDARGVTLGGRTGGSHGSAGFKRFKAHTFLIDVG